LVLREPINAKWDGEAAYPPLVSFLRVSGEDSIFQARVQETAQSRWWGRNGQAPRKEQEGCDEYSPADGRDHRSGGVSAAVGVCRAGSRQPCHINHD
jgi:hypothetical protein